MATSLRFMYPKKKKIKLENVINDINKLAVSQLNIFCSALNKVLRIISRFGVWVENRRVVSK